MKIAQLSTSDLGGAGIAAKNLHLALLQEGIDSTFVSQLHLGPGFNKHVLLQEEPPSPTKKLVARARNIVFGQNSAHLSAYYLRNKPPGFEHFSFPWSSIEPYALKEVRDADIIHLNWVSDGFLDYKKLFAVHKKFVWTLHDMNPFTGGCHHSDGCTKFTGSCNYCPQLKGTVDEYLSAKIFNYKLKALDGLPDDGMVVVAPSRWLADLSSKSTVLGRFKHRVIRNVINFPATGVSRDEVRRLHRIKENETVFLFVAHHFDNPRKGINTLLNALELLSPGSYRVFTIGEKQARYEAAGFEQLGYIKDRDEMKKLYTMADAFVLPSMAENFPNTVVEALLCGTPVIASRVGGIVEQVDASNGLLVDTHEPFAWAQALRAFISKKETYNREEIKKNAGIRFDNQSIVKETIALYKELTEGRN